MNSVRREQLYMVSLARALCFMLHYVNDKVHTLYVIADVNMFKVMYVFVECCFVECCFVESLLLFFRYLFYIYLFIIIFIFIY